MGQPGTAAHPVHVSISVENITGDHNVGGDLDVVGGATVGGALGVTGAATVGSTLAVTGNVDLTADLAVGGDLTVTGGATVTGDAAVTGNAAVTGDTTLTGDLAVSGNATGFNVPVGPFYDVTAASQTAKTLKYGDTLGFSWVAPLPGSVVGLSGMLDAGVTGADIGIAVYKNGTVINASAAIVFSAGGGAVNATTFAKALYTFDAGDKLDVRYTTLITTNTPKLVANIMVAV